MDDRNADRWHFIEIANNILFIKNQLADKMGKIKGSVDRLLMAG